MVIEISGLVLEFIAVAISIHFIWGLHMPLKKRLSVSVIFAGRLLYVNQRCGAVFAQVLTSYSLVPVVGLRLWKLSIIHPTSPDVTVSEFTAAALELAFILASITCLKPFLRPFHEGYYVTTAANSAGTGYSVPKKDSRSDTYLMLSTPHSTTDNVDGTISHTDAKRGVEDSVQRPKPTMDLRPDNVTHQATGVFAEHAPDTADMRDGRISRTQAWRVSYEEGRGSDGKKAQSRG